MPIQHHACFVAKSKKLKHSQPGEQPGLQPQKTARQASVSKPKALKLPRFFKLLNTQQAASAAHQQVPTTDPQAMTGHVAVTCNIFDQLDNTKKPSIQTLQDAATSTLNDLAAQHELEKKLYVDAKKPPAKSTASNSQPFTMANAFTSMWNDIEQSRPPDCHQHLLANQDKKKKSNKQKTARFKRRYTHNSPCHCFISLPACIKLRFSDVKCQTSIANTIRCCM